MKKLTLHARYHIAVSIGFLISIIVLVIILPEIKENTYPFVNLITCSLVYIVILFHIGKMRDNYIEAFKKRFIVKTIIKQVYDGENIFVIKNILKEAYSKEEKAQIEEENGKLYIITQNDIFKVWQTPGFTHVKNLKSNYTINIEH